MTNDNQQDLPPNRKRLAMELKDALASMRALFVATVSLVITLSETLPRSKQLPESKQLSELDPVNESQSGEIEVQEKKYEPKDYDINESSQTKLAIEQFTPKRVLKDGIYLLLASVSTIALVVGVGRLAPIAKWAGTQNECIEDASAIGGINGSSLPNKVKNCNGGHD